MRAPHPKKNRKQGLSKSDGPRFVIAESTDETKTRPRACTKTRAVWPPVVLVPGLPISVRSTARVMGGSHDALRMRGEVVVRLPSLGFKQRRMVNRSSIAVSDEEREEPGRVFRLD